MKANATIREDMKKRGIPQWMVATQLHISENTLVRWLRTPLSKEREEDVQRAIAAAAKAKEAGDHA